MRVLHLINGLETGGAEMMLLKLVEGIDDSRFTSAVVSMCGVGTIGPRIEKLGVPVFPLGMEASLRDVTCVFSLQRIVRQWRPDIIHTWLYHASLAALPATRWFGTIKLCWSFHACELDFTRYPRSFRNIFGLARRFSRSPDAIVVVSHASRRWHESMGFRPKLWLHIPIGVDPVEFQPDPSARRAFRTELGIPHDAPVVGLVANYIPEKDHRNFLAAIALGRSSIRTLHAVMVGRGVDSGNSELVRHVSGFGLTDQVHLLGERHDVPRLMNGFDAFCLSSRSESCPNVLIESMACGIPCVATDVGDSGHIIGDTGAVVPPGNPDVLAHALIQLLQGENRGLMGLRARERAQQMFSLDSVIKRYEDSYAEL